MVTGMNQRTERRRVTILGSTGSIGDSTIDLIERNPDAYEVAALTANGNWAKLADQAKRLKPAVVAVADPSCYPDLKAALAGTSVHVAAGPEGVCEAAAVPSDWVMAAIVGAAGLKPTLTAVARGAVIALANKECLVSAGTVFTDAVARHKATLLPVDSEHNAIFQVFDFDQKRHIRKIILTASGGPFRTWSTPEMREATPKQAVAHPNWSMGAKISVDSATMMNKALEVIEASYLFGLPGSRIEVVIHPQSVIHSMVQYHDRSVVAQLGTPDMRGPIAYGLSWPERIDSGASALDFSRLGALSFEKPDERRFPGLRLAWEALEGPVGTTAVLNAANEVAVAAFLDERLRFDQIHQVNDATLQALVPSKPQQFADLLAIDAEARAVAAAQVGRLAA